MLLNVLNVTTWTSQAGQENTEDREHTMEEADPSEPARRLDQRGNPASFQRRSMQSPKYCTEAGIQ